MSEIEHFIDDCDDSTWLLHVVESHECLNESNPIWVHKSTVTSDESYPQPQRHPFCEINFVLEGAPGYSMIGKEKALRKIGDLLLLGPGIPHHGVATKYPMTFITIYFLPSVLIELGPETDGIQVLRRFTASQPASRRIVHLPASSRADFRNRFEEIHEEFIHQRFGREMRLRTLLVEMLVKLVRWEISHGDRVNAVQLEVDWMPIVKIIRYLRDHYSEPVYSKELARAAGLSESRLKSSFRSALGTSWLTFLRGYRIRRAVALMNDGSHNISEAALSVGFDSLSHFNLTFRAFMGISPTGYMRRIQIKKNLGK